MASIERIKGSNGSGEAVRAVVQTLRLSGSATLDVDSVTNWSGDFIGTYGTPDGNGSVTSASVRVFYGTVSGTDINITGFAPGYTDNGNAVGDIVVLKPTTAWADNIAEILALTFNDDGTLKTGIIPTAAYADASVTPDKISLGATADATAAEETTTSTSYTNLATTDSVTLTVPSTGTVFVIASITRTTNSTTGTNLSAVEVSGANTIAATDTFSIRAQNTNQKSGVVQRLYTGLTPGSTTFTLKHRVTSGTGTFGGRYITAIPLG